MEITNFKTMEEYLNFLKYEDKVFKIVKKYGLSKSLVRISLRPYYTNLEPIHVAQAHAVHLSLVKRYYEIYGKMLESEFNLLLSYFGDTTVQSLSKFKDA